MIELLAHSSEVSLLCREAIMGNVLVGLIQVGVGAWPYCTVGVGGHYTGCVTVGTNTFGIELA